MNHTKAVSSPTIAGAITSSEVLRGVVFCLGMGWFTSGGATEPTGATTTSPVRAAHAAQSAGLTTCTDAGQAVEADPEHLAGITELRQLTGFTWDRVAELFGVSRRAVHHWASGKPMSGDNEVHLQRCLHTLRAVDRGDAMVNRQALLSVGDAGKSPFDLLVLQRYAEAIEMLGRAVDSLPTRRMPRVTVPPERLPTPPEVLADARDDVTVRDSGPRRTVQVVRRGRAA